MQAAIFWNRLDQDGRQKFCIERAHMDPSTAALYCNSAFVNLPAAVKIAVYSCDEWRNSAIDITD